jgi:hypothetical protein
VAVNPYTSVSILGYNSSPPPDDGSQTSANKVEWAKHKNKIGDPIKTLAESINTNALAAANALALQPWFISTTSATIAETDWNGGYLQLASGNIYYPDPSTYEDGWHNTVFNGSTGIVSLQATATSYWTTANGLASEVLLRPGESAKAMNTASSWLAVGSAIRSGELMQEQFAFDTTCITATGVITGGLPAATDGTQHLSVSITPNKLGNLIEVHSSIFLAPQGNAGFSCAMFRGTASAAIAAASKSAGGTDNFDNLNMTTWVTATQVTAYTFTVRAGAALGSHTLNGVSSGILLGGGIKSFIKVMELNV